MHRNGESLDIGVIMGIGIIDVFICRYGKPKDVLEAKTAASISCWVISVKDRASTVRGKVYTPSTGLAQHIDY